MRLILHLVLTDLRRLRGWVLFAAVLVGALTAIGFVLLATPLGASERETYATWHAYALACAVLRGLQALAAYVFVLLLVQGDRALGTTAFWLTRPVSGLRMMVAKVVTMSVTLVLIPTLVSLPWWWWCGFGWREGAIAALEFGAAALAIGVPAAFVAALTDSLGRAVLWGSLIVPIAAVLALGSLVPHATSPGQLADRALLAAGVALLTFGTVTVSQYVWRRPGISISVLAVGIVATLTAASWDRASAPDEPGRWSRHAELGHPVRLEPAGVAGDRIKVDGVLQARLSVGFNVVDRPPGLVMVGGLVQQTWSAANQAPIQREGFVERLSDPAAGYVQAVGLHARTPDPETAAWMKKRQEEYWAEREAKYPGRYGRPRGTWRAPDLVIRTTMPLTLAEQIKTTAPAYEARMYLVLRRPRVVDELPLTQPGWRAEAGVGLKIASVQWRRHLSVAVVETDPDVVIARWLGRERGFTTRFACIAVNREQKEAVPCVSRPLVNLTVNSVIVSCGSVGFSNFLIRNGEAVAIVNDAWFDRATLARLTFDVVARFTRDVTVDRFEVQPAGAESVEWSGLPGKRE